MTPWRERRAGGGSLWMALLCFGAGLLVLNALLIFENRWPGPGVLWWPRVSAELVWGVGLLVLWTAWRGPLSGRALTGLSLVFLLLVVARYAEVTAPAMMGRQVHIYWDGRHLWGLYRVATATWPTWQMIGVWALAIGAVLLALLSVRVALAALMPAVARRGLRAPLLAAVAVGTAAYAAHEPGVRDTRGHVAQPITPGLFAQGLLLARVWLPGQEAAVLGDGPDFSTELSALMGDEGPTDVVLLFAESYGAVTLDDDDMAARLDLPRQRLAEALTQGSYGVVSARVRAATFGGASWLSHASLLSGIDTSDPARYNLLLASERRTLVSHFSAHGYRTVGWMPGIKRPWPEGAFYRFDRLADDAALGYLGPDFGFWRIPDQASMALLDAQELGKVTPARSPVFAVFPTVTTHAPFHPLPPVLPDPKQAMAIDGYAPSQVEEAMRQPPTWRSARSLYLQSMSDQFDWLAAHFRAHAQRPLLMIVVGDHQPPGVLSGRDASWDVPVHVISSDASLLRRFEGLGFVPGLIPPRDTLSTMHGLTQMLLDAFDRGIDTDSEIARQPPQPVSQAWTSPDGA